MAMIKLPELKLLMKQNSIRGYSMMNKPEIVTLLLEKGVLSKQQIIKPEKPFHVVNPKYAHLASIRNNPLRVEIHDVETGGVTTYPSLYKASRAIGLGVKSIKNNDGKVWREKYAIKVS